jgi:hypothetical protein
MCRSIGLSKVCCSVTLRSFRVLNNRYNYKANIIVCYYPRPLVNDIVSLTNFQLGFL